MIAGVIVLALWTGGLLTLAWRILVAVDKERFGKAWLLLTVFVVVLVAGIVGVYQLGEAWS